MKQVGKKAASMGSKAGKMKKFDLIHTIQIEDGNPPCFLTVDESCDQADCCWRSDWLPASINNMRQY